MSIRETPFLLAAADIGSNAIRIVFVSVHNQKLQQEQKLRLPVRIRGDNFTQNTISEKGQNQLLSVLSIYQQMINLYQPQAHRICATAALREASNREDVICKVSQHHGLDIDVIDGQTEAQLIFKSLRCSECSNIQRGLHVDMGGGSTELIQYQNDSILKLATFKNGALRYGSEKQRTEDKRMHEWIEAKENLSITASGGGADQIYHLIGDSQTRRVSKKDLKKLTQQLESLELSQRIIQYRLRPDRADTIIPACRLILKIMDWSKQDSFYPLQVGLLDGILQQLCLNLQATE